MALSSNGELLFGLGPDVRTRLGEDGLGWGAALIAADARAAPIASLGSAIHRRWSRQVSSIDLDVRGDDDQSSGWASE
jgi:hypothetical protein